MKLPWWIKNDKIVYDEQTKNINLTFNIRKVYIWWIWIKVIFSYIFKRK